MSKIVELVDGLPQENLTVRILKAMDFAVPGKWENLVGFDRTIEVLTGESNPSDISRIKNCAVDLYENKKNGYQTAIWLYQTADSTDKAAAAAAIADKVGNKFRFIPLIDRLTPKADAIQSLDLKLKLAAELIAFSKLSGAGINPVKFASGIKDNYHKEALLRMVALICFDGILPLGTNFISRLREEMSQGSDPITKAALDNFSDLIPAEDKQQFINDNFNEVSSWMDQIIDKFGLTRESVTDKLGGFIEIADDKLDYLAAFIDASTNFFEHTGIQTVARYLVLRAYDEVKS